MVFGVALAWCLFIVLVGLLTACATVPPPPAIVVSGCALVKPPPARPVLHFVKNCVSPYSDCLTHPDAVTLRIWLAEMTTWQDDAFQRCAK